MVAIVLEILLKCEHRKTEQKVRKKTLNQHIEKHVVTLNHAFLQTKDIAHLLVLPVTQNAQHTNLQLVQCGKHNPSVIESSCRNSALQ